MITIYKDASANAIFIEDANGVQFLNSLQTTVENGYCNIHDLARNIQLVSNAAFDVFQDENGQSYGNNSTEVCNALNAVFQSTGTPTANAPNITSNLTIALVQGETLNYELTALYGVAYEWDLSNVNGVANVEGNVRKLVGGSSLTAGTYNIPVKAINYNGEDSEIIVLTVSEPPFANTKSISFEFQDWAGGNASLLSSTLGRASNGAGASDAWSVGLWFKGSTSTNNGQTIFYYGDSDTANGSFMYLRYRGGNNDTLRFRYGSNNNYLQWDSAANTLPAGTWKHVVLTYDGGSTGSGSGSVSSYYGRFNVFIDGVNVSNAGTWTNNNYGYSAGIDPDNFRIGRFSSGNYMQNLCKVDELCIWDSDQTNNISDIYNSGTPFDLSTLTTAPKHWWRMGDGDTYPYLEDSGTEGNCVLEIYNMTAANIVNDVP